MSTCVFENQMFISLLCSHQHLFAISVVLDFETICLKRLLQFQGQKLFFLNFV